MPYLNVNDFVKVHKALQSGRDFFAGADADELDQALALMKSASEAVASVQLRDIAESIHGSDDIEIDDEGAGTSEASNGTWVQAWVYVPREDIELPDADD